MVETGGPQTHWFCFVFVFLAFTMLPSSLCHQSPFKFLFPHPPSNLKQNLNIGKVHRTPTCTCCLDSLRNWGGIVAPYMFSVWHLPPIGSDIASSVTSPSLPAASQHQHLVSASVHHYIVVLNRAILFCTHVSIKGVEMKAR